MANFFDTFVYVDGHFQHREKKLSSKWVRVQARHIKRAVIDPAGGSNCFMTVQRFKDSISNRESSKEDKEARDLEPDMYGDQQPHYHGLYFDFDASPEKTGLTEIECLELARGEALRVARVFSERFQLPEPCLQAWFSGRKGFHLLVRPEPFNIVPHRNLSYIVQKVALDFIHNFELKTLDKTVYSIPRMWRIANTTHHSTGKYKVELRLSELEQLKVVEILELASEPRMPGFEDYVFTGEMGSHLWTSLEYSNIGKDTACEAWWKDYVTQYEAGREIKNLRPKKRIERPEGSNDAPACVKDILEGGPKPGSKGRNHVLMALVAFFKDAGYDKDEAHRLVKEWTEQHFPGKDIRDRLSNGKSVVDSVFRAPLYAFSCRTMLSNRGTGTEGQIACLADKCKWVKNPTDQTAAEVPLVHLSEASAGAYHGTKVVIPVHVSGIGKSPYGLPRKVRLKCFYDKESNLCGTCDCAGTGEKKIVTFSAADRDILCMIDVRDNNRKGALKQKFGIPAKCFKCGFDILEQGTLEEVQIIPMSDYAQTYQAEEKVEEDDKATKNPRQACHVLRRAFHFGHGIQANKKYKIESYPFEHPLDQSIVFVFEKKEDAQNDIDQFKMTPDIYRKLLAFQPVEGQTVREKMTEIHKDFEANVHQIRGRHDLSMAVDLCYHSIIGFKFQGQPVNRGWFELLVVGDSGTGKTTLVERLIGHFGLGELLAGEEAKRTGLVYSSIQVGNNWVIQWGKIPQNDRRLLVIDEFAAIPKEEVGKLTQLRSEGKARGQGVAANYETFARARLIFLSNPRHGPLKSYTYGLEAVAEIFAEHQDLRRTDWAMCCATEDVATTVINQSYMDVKVLHRYTSDLCQKLLFWAWSRDPHHVEYQPGVEDYILKRAAEIGNTYSCDVYLADRSDMRVKIARIATACAARLFSTDSEAKKVIVKKEHVDFVVEEMDRSYRKPAMAYYEYSKAYQQANTITKERGESIKKELERYEDSDNLITGLLKMPWFNKGQLRDTLPYPKDEFEKLWRFMMQNNLITPRATGYKKTPAFTEFLKKVGSIFSGFTRDSGERHLKSLPLIPEAEAVPLPEEPPIEYEVSEDQDWQQVSMELLEEKDGDD